MKKRHYEADFIIDQIKYLGDLGDDGFLNESAHWSGTICRVPSLFQHHISSIVVTHNINVAVLQPGIHQHDHVDGNLAQVCLAQGTEQHNVVQTIKELKEQVKTEIINE